MPYHLKIDKRKKKPYLIVRDEDSVVVGASDTKAKAQRSIGYRMEAVKRTEQVNKALKLRK